MLIVIEGSDGVGKSTLVDTLEAQFKALYEDDGNFKMVHFGPPEDRLENEGLIDYSNRCHARFYEELDKYDPTNFTDLWVLDRAHWGSPVYGSLFRPKTNLMGFGDLGRNNFFEFELYLAKQGAYTAWLSPDPDVVVARALARDEGEDEYLDSVSESTEIKDRQEEREDQIRKIMGRYQALVRDAGDYITSYPNHPYYASTDLIDKPGSAEANGSFNVAGVLGDQRERELRSWELSTAGNVTSNPLTWPAIAFSQDVEKVAHDIISRAAIAQTSAYIFRAEAEKESI